MMLVKYISTAEYFRETGSKTRPTILPLIMLPVTFLTVFGLVATSLSSPTKAHQQPLRFTTNGTFQLCIFEDLHFGEAENLDWGRQQDVNTTRVMNTVLDVESPQLVVLNGDLITGENTYLTNSTHYVDEIVQPLVQRGLSWASTCMSLPCYSKMHAH